MENESNDKKRMQELVEILNQAARAYYQDAAEIMSNYEYDKLYDELLALEEKTGVTLSGSPSIHVGYEVLSELPKEAHESQMLSLDKTKEIEDLKSFLDIQKAVISWKLDGLTIVLTYQEGELKKAVTRGNGEVGEVITNNVKVFQNLPLKIEYKGELVLRGEAVIGYKEFEKINKKIEDVEAKYKNPRNLCSGSVRQLNNEITAERNVNFFAFSLVRAENIEFHNSRNEQLTWLEKQGFQVVEHSMVTREEVEEKVVYFEGKIKENEYPSDGLVLIYDDIAYGTGLGNTAKFPRDSYAFKWEDEIRETTLLEIEWSPSRTGLINPVAIFEPVELEGTPVSRASVHNISILEELELGIGDRIEVYKANMIIPQIAQNITRSANLEFPKVCPVCGGETEIRQMNQTRALYCSNMQCQAKRMKSFSLFVSRDALNIEGLSEATLEKFILNGFIKQFADIFHLEKYEEEIQTMEGFGVKSYQNLQESIKFARNTTLPKLLYALGIEGIGSTNAKLICKAVRYETDKLPQLTLEELNDIDGIGPILAEAFVKYFTDEENKAQYERILKEVVLEAITISEEEQIFEGINFVITGNVEHFENRKALKEVIESKGGKVTGSVTSKTTYLINNNVTSASSKNKKAKELGVAIITEEEFLKLNT